MPLWKAIKGTLKMFWSMTLEDWHYMDHKLVRLVTMLIGFTLAALFWWYFLRGIIPFGF